jgi:hypothetical protein
MDLIIQHFLDFTVKSKETFPRLVRRERSWWQVAHAYNRSYSRGRDQEDCNIRPGRAKSETLAQKYPTQKRAGKVAQVAEHLPIKCEAPNSNPSTTKEREKEKTGSF